MANVAAGQPPRRKGLMQNPLTWVVVGVVVVGGYLLYRYRSAQSAAAAGTTATDTTGTTDYSGEIATLQSEIADLQSSQAQAGGGAGGVTAGPVSGEPGPYQPGGAGGGGGGTPPQPPGEPPPYRPGKPPIPALVRVTRTTSDSISLSWSKSPGATSYRIRLTYQGKLARQQTATGTTATVTGLTPDHTYTVHVAAVGPGGTSAETNGPAAKTKRSAGPAPKAAAHSVRRVA